MARSKTQSLNEWLEMLHGIYGGTQNYNKTEYELLAHLMEVCGAFGKHLLKRRDPAEAIKFLPKMFSWATALLVKVKGTVADAEAVVLTKIPGLCPYCVQVPCACHKEKSKRRIDDKVLRDHYCRQAARMEKRSPNDFQVMFCRIYEKTWSMGGTADEIHTSLQRMFTRLVEELAEVAEAVRFRHLHPANFDNEVADYLAWWFALVSSVHHAFSDGREQYLADDILWAEYPGFCRYCGVHLCQCVPKPVRELLSKPSMDQLSHIDPLTQAKNKRAFDEDVHGVSSGAYPFATPIACVQVDLDNFGAINKSFGQGTGDDVLRNVVNTIRQRSRTRDWLYRVGGDEFTLICPDLSVAEAKGMLERVQRHLKQAPIAAVTLTGEARPIATTLSIGIGACDDASQLATVFEKVDKAAYTSKQSRDTITVV